MAFSSSSSSSHETIYNMLLKPIIEKTIAVAREHKKQYAQFCLGRTALVSKYLPQLKNCISRDFAKDIAFKHSTEAEDGRLLVTYTLLPVGA